MEFFNFIIIAFVMFHTAAGESHKLLLQQKKNKIACKYSRFCSAREGGGGGGGAQDSRCTF